VRRSGSRGGRGAGIFADLSEVIRFGRISHAVFHIGRSTTPSIWRCGAVLAARTTTRLWTTTFWIGQNLQLLPGPERNRTEPDGTAAVTWHTQKS
jgi:hypothetical protein